MQNPHLISIESESTVPGKDPSTASVVTPKVFSISQHTVSVASQDYAAAGYHVTSASEADSGPAQKADAETVTRIQLTKWYIDSGAEYGVEIDSDGNILSHGSYEVSKIDTSKNTVTTWVLPDGWRIDRSYDGSAVDSDGNYYFSANGNITRFNPDTGVFTQWDLYSHPRMLYVNGGIYFEPDESSHIAKNNGNLNITSLNKDHNYIRISGEGSSGTVKAEIVTPSGQVYTARSNTNSDATFEIWSNAFLDDWKVRDDEMGNYTVTVTDLFSTDSATLRINMSGNQIYSPLNFDTSQSDTHQVFFQKLDPRTGELTFFFSDLLDGACTALNSHDDASLYFSTFANRHELSGIMKFSMETGQITHWSNIAEFHDEDFCYGGSKFTVSDKKIYWGSHDRSTLKIASLDTDTGAIREVAAPYSCDYGVGSIVPTDSESILFTGCNGNNLYQFEYHDETFTRYSGYSWFYDRYGWLDHDSTQLVNLYEGYSPDTLLWQGDNRGYNIFGTLNVTDFTRPTVTLTPTNVMSGTLDTNFVSFEVRSSEPVRGLSHAIEIDDEVDPDNYVYYDIDRPEDYERNSYYDSANFNLTVHNSGTITVQIPKGFVYTEDYVRNSASNIHELTFDLVQPSVHLNATSALNGTTVNNNTISFTASFSESVTGFSLGAVYFDYKPYFILDDDGNLIRTNFLQIESTKDYEHGEYYDQIEFNLVASGNVTASILIPEHQVENSDGIYNTASDTYVFTLNFTADLEPEVRRHSGSVISPLSGEVEIGILLPVIGNLSRTVRKARWQ